MHPENTNRVQLPATQDLQVFVAVVREQNFAAAARALGVSPAYISKRIMLLESALATRLLHRTTRTLTLTSDGERTYHWALQVLNNLDDLLGDLVQSRNTPGGHLAICSSSGFGRRFVAPAVSELAALYPQLTLRLDVSDRTIDLVSEGFDLEIHVGNDLPGQYVSRLLLKNRRILCAAPSYLERYGVPQTLADLAQHQCLVLKEKSNVFGVWSLHSDEGINSVRIGGALSANNGDIVMQWALAGRGIVLRSQWDADAEIRAGHIVHILPDYYEPADIWAVYPTRLSESAKLRACVNFMQDYFVRQQGL